jgi:hypothetical protein
VGGGDLRKASAPKMVFKISWEKRMVSKSDHNVFPFSYVVAEII